MKLFTYLFILSVALISCDKHKQIARILQNNPDLKNIEYIFDTLRVVDYVKNDSIVYKDSIIEREKLVIKVPPTKYEIRYKFKTNKQREITIRDSMEALVAISKNETKSAIKLGNKAVKLAKEERRINNSDNRKDKAIDRWDGLIALGWSIFAILVMVIILIFVIRSKK